MSDDTEFVRSNHAAIWRGAGATAYAPLPICTASLNQSHSPNEAETERGAVPPEVALALKDDAVRDLALRAAGLSEHSLKAIADMVDSVRALEDRARPA